MKGKLGIFNNKSLAGLVYYYRGINNLSGEGSTHEAVRMLKKDLGIKDLLAAKKKELEFEEDNWAKTKEILKGYEGYENIPVNLEKFLQQNIAGLDPGIATEICHRAK